MFFVQQSEPSTDVDILGVKMSVLNSEMLTLQTTWNMEMPYEIMLGVKKQVPAVMEVVSESAVITYNEVNKHVRSLEGSFAQARKQGNVMLEKAANSLEAVKSCKFLTTVTDNTVFILKKYQKKVERFLGAVVKFLRETRFRVPGYEEKLSGLEVYQKCSAFVADVSEEAVEKIPEYISSMFASAFDYFQATEFKFPGSNRIVSGKEILDDLLVALKKIQHQVIVTVRKLGNIKLEDIINKLSAIMQFTIQQSEKLLQTLKSQNLGTLSDFVSAAYNDAMNSPVLIEVTKQVEEVRRIVMEYLKAVSAKLRSILGDLSSEQLTADIQSWVNSVVKGINTIHNNIVAFMKEKSKNVDKYVRVSDQKVEVDIPLPFVAKFN